MQVSIKGDVVTVTFPLGELRPSKGSNGKDPVYDINPVSRGYAPTEVKIPDGRTLYLNVMAAARISERKTNGK